MFYFNKICIGFSFYENIVHFIGVLEITVILGWSSWYFVDGTELINAVAESVYTYWKVRVTPPRGA